ncbi:MAG: tol-pal system protein YbgF [Gemmatimonadota bacterium]|nr:tol-pal system protein YbgF [Gemmatimonadota bacterium]
MRQRVRRASLALSFGASCLLAGCFATSEDVKQVHNDLVAMRAERSQADSATRVQVQRVVASLAVVNDSLGALTARVNKLQGDVRGDLYSIGQQLLSIQELTGQSQRRLQDLRTTLEAKNPDQVFGPTGATTDSASRGAAGGPGPNQLFQLALEQLRRGSAGTARAGFEDLVKRFPDSDVAPDAQFYLGEALAAQGDAAAADGAYVTVVTHFPKSGRASTALYKHALILQAKGQAAAAKAALTDVVQKYPRSDEAALARDRLRVIK